MIEDFTFTGTADVLRGRVEELRDAGYSQFTVQLVEGHEDALADWAKLLGPLGLKKGTKKKASPTEAQARPAALTQPSRSAFLHTSDSGEATPRSDRSSATKPQRAPEVRAVALERRRRRRVRAAEHEARDRVRRAEHVRSRDVGPERLELDAHLLARGERAAP